MAKKPLNQANVAPVLILLNIYVIYFSEIVSILKTPESEGSYRTHLLQASEKLGKTLNQEEICSVFEKLTQKSSSEMYVNLFPWLQSYRVFFFTFFILNHLTE